MYVRPPIYEAALGQASHRTWTRGHALAGRRAYGGRKILREVFQGRFAYEKSHFLASDGPPPSSGLTHGLEKDSR